MAKFQAASMQELRTVARMIGRYQRGVNFIVAVEADDGSWFELDANDSEHAKVLAQTQVDKMNARGCSCWTIKNNGGFNRIPFYTCFASYEIEKGDIIS